MQSATACTCVAMAALDLLLCTSCGSYGNHSSNREISNDLATGARGKLIRGGGRRYGPRYEKGRKKCTKYTPGEIYTGHIYNL